MGELKKAARRGRSAWWATKDPLYVPPGHFYSPIPGRADRARVSGTVPDALEGVDLRADEQLALATELAPLWKELASGFGGRYDPVNPAFGLADGAVYYAMLRHLRPHRVIEIGSGHSSALALDARERHLPDLELTFVEPYPALLHSLLRNGDRVSTTIIPSPVQDVPLATFDTLEAGDILFIDSTHVSKVGSDVNRLFFDVLPRLVPGVFVHVHDVFWPFEYPTGWLQDNRGWNEDYLLRAFLTFNNRFEITLFSSWLWKAHPEFVRSTLPGAIDELPGSIWLRKA